MKRALSLVVALAVVTMAGWAVTTRMRQAGPGEKTQHKVVKVERGTVKKTVSASGTLQPWTVVDIKSKAGGRVDQLLVDAGSVVQKGQVLARIDPSDTQLTVNTAQADIDSARAREQQNRSSYDLQVRQSGIAIANARAQLGAANAGLQASRARLRTAQDQARAQPAQTNTAIRQAEANYRSTLKQREQLQATQPQERAQAQAAFDQAEANNKNAEASVRRQESLVAKGFVSQQVVDQAQANFGGTRAQLQAARERLRSIEAEQLAARETAEARASQAQAQVENARAQSVDIENRRNAAAEARSAVAQAQAQVAQAQAGLEQALANRATNQIRGFDIETARAGTARAQATFANARNTLAQSTVRAPADGVVLKKYVEQGTIITSGLSLNSTGTSILQIGDVSKMYVNVTVDETDIANVDEGQVVEVTVEAYPGVPFEGKVARVDPQAQVEQNVTTVAVRVEVDNASPTFRLLKPGMNATCEFVIDKKDDALLVPTEAVRTDDNGTFVEVASGGKPAPADPKTGTPPDPDALVDVKTARRVVEVGLEGNEAVEVTSGLKDGDTVVTQTIEATPQTAGGSPFAGSRSPGSGGGGGGRR